MRYLSENHYSEHNMANLCLNFVNKFLCLANKKCSQKHIIQMRNQITLLTKKKINQSFESTFITTH